MTTPLFDVDRRLNLPAPTPDGEAVTGEAVAAKFVVAVKAVLNNGELSIDETRHAVGGYVAEASRYNRQQDIGELSAQVRNLTTMVQDGFNAIDQKIDATNQKIDIINQKVDALTGTVNALTATVNTMKVSVYGDRRRELIVLNVNNALLGDPLVPVPYRGENPNAPEPITSVNEIETMTMDKLVNYCSAYRTIHLRNVDHGRDLLAKEIIGMDFATYGEKLARRNEQAACQL